PTLSPTVGIHKIRTSRSIGCRLVRCAWSRVSFQVQPRSDSLFASVSLFGLGLLILNESHEIASTNSRKTPIFQTKSDCFSSEYESNSNQNESLTLTLQRFFDCSPYCVSSPPGSRRVSLNLASFKSAPCAFEI